MRSVVAVRVIVAAGALGVLLAALSPGAGLAGEFTVASCQADPLEYSSSAFADFETRGMDVRRACDPEGSGRRGLITKNVIRAGSVPRGAVSVATITAAAGTTFTTLGWAGSARHRDCRYALQLYAEVPGGAIPIKNVRGCSPDTQPRYRAELASYRLRTFNINGATRIVQRVICAAPGHKTCSTRGANYLRTYKAIVGVADAQPPSATITAAPDTPLATGAWVGGASEPLRYDAQDNVGVRRADAIVGGVGGGADERPCAMATKEGAFANPLPCPNGPGEITVDTSKFPEGTQQLVVQAQDSAGNPASSAPVVVRIDHTPPASVDIAVDGGELWTSEPDFKVSWSNPAEPDRAPITGALYKLCPAAGGNCIQGEQDGDAISSVAVKVPGPGQYTVSVWRKDGAANQDSNTASVPVSLRYDPEAPQLAFEAPSQSDPTLVSVPVSDKTSGPAGGMIEIGQAGTWRTLDTQLQDGRLVARIDDAALPAGDYALRASAYDQAHNEASTSQRVDGQPMTVTLPLRIASVMQAGVPHKRTVHRIVRRHGKRQRVRQRVTVLRPTGRVKLGRQVRISGRLANRDGQGVAGAEIQVLSRSQVSPEQLVAVLHTDAQGAYTYTATASASRVLRFAYAGSALVLPAQAEVQLRVPAASSLHVSRHRVRNRQTVTFSGRVRTLPVPAAGKLVALQVRASGRWRTFRTTRTDQAGHWALRYRFTRTYRPHRYRFRVELPAEAGSPFASGASKSVRVHARGR